MNAKRDQSTGSFSKLSRRLLLGSGLGAAAALSPCGALAQGFLDRMLGRPNKPRNAVLYPSNYFQGEPYLGLPQLTERDFLRVVYIENPDLPPTPLEFQRALLRRTFDLMQRYLGTKISGFQEPKKLRIGDVFAAINPDEIRLQRDTLVPFKTGELMDGQREQVIRNLVNDFEASGQPIASIIEYCKPYLIRAPKEFTARELGANLVDTHWQKLQEIRRSTTASGAKLITEKPYNEFAYWAALDSARLPYEVIITNQLLCSMETTSAALHGSLRGGVSNGITAASGSAQFGTYSVVSTYPMTQDDAWLKTLRGQKPNERFTPEQMVEFAALILTHELGHQLRHWRHPYGRRDCLLSPTPALDFVKWTRELSTSCDAAAMKAAGEPLQIPAPRYFSTREVQRTK